MIRYPDRAVPALVRLYRRFNDITVFVEDATYSNMYQAYFERMLDGEAKLKKVFPLHGRENVIKLASGGRVKRYAPCLFIIDGDLDLLLARPSPKIPDLYRLSHYCAENLLICEQASVELGFESSPDDKKSKIRKSIKFGRWKRAVVSLLFPLYVKYAVVHQFGLPIKTTKYHVQQLCDGNAPNRALSKSKISTRIMQIQNEILQHISKRDLRQAEKEIRAKACRDIDGRAKYISGKTYLLPLLAIHLRQTTKLRDQEAALPVRLARHADLKVDDGLFQRIRALINVSAPLTETA